MELLLVLFQFCCTAWMGHCSFKVYGGNWCEYFFIGRGVSLPLYDTGKYTDAI